MSEKNGYKSWIELSAPALAHNMKTIRGVCAPETEIFWVVKANAYGHGARDVVRTMLREGATSFAVDTIDEAGAVREVAGSARIICLGYVPDAELVRAVSSSVELVLTQEEQLPILEAAASANAKTAPIHIKIETGACRQGIFAQDLSRFIYEAKKYPHIRIVGCSTHFSRSEEGSGGAYTKGQAKALYDAVGAVAADLPDLSFVHAASSAATFLYPETHGTAVRPGLALYGYWPSGETEQYARRTLQATLEPVLSWYSILAQVKDVPAGTPVSYGGTEIVGRPTRIGVVPIGYYDGYDRRLSSKGDVLVRGARCKVLGRVCMNMIMVDVSRVPQPKREERVTIIGQDGAQRVTADDLAKITNTVSWEVLARLSSHTARKVV